MLSQANSQQESKETYLPNCQTNSFPHAIITLASLALFNFKQFQQYIGIKGKNASCKND